MKIRDVLADKGRVVTVWPEKSLGQIARMIDERNTASVVVKVHAERPLGIVTDRDILRSLAHRGAVVLAESHRGHAESATIMQP